MTFIDNVRNTLNNNPKLFLGIMIAMEIALLGMGVYFAISLTELVIWPFILLILTSLLIGMLSSRMVLFIGRHFIKKN
ncbi:MAG: hypothetical protein K5659_01660 [Lachnospiraceae bacterium]|jgi:hypothetical protein|nr:hypothetical protein [Lachnospiraceae bacterium]